MTNPKHVDTQYEDLLRFVLKNGTKKDDRTKTGTISYFAPPQLRYNMANGFPLLTTKKVHIRSVLHELLWFISGSSNIKYLTDNNVTIWDEWDKGDGELGPVYGPMWRKLPNPYFYMSDEEAPFKHGNEKPTIDQLAEVIEGIKKDPDSRRHIIATYFPPAVPYQALPPCHSWVQFYVNGDKLSLQWYQRSIDLFLGLAFNISSYAFLLHAVAQQTGLTPHEIILAPGDAHIYSNHLEQVELQLSREPRLFPDFQLATHPATIDDYTFDDFIITNYNPHPAIPAPIAV